MSQTGSDVTMDGKPHVFCTEEDVSLVLDGKSYKLNDKPCKQEIIDYHGWPRLVFTLRCVDEPKNLGKKDEEPEEAEKQDELW